MTLRQIAAQDRAFRRLYARARWANGEPMTWWEYADDYATARGGGGPEEIPPDLSSRTEALREIYEAELGYIQRKRAADRCWECAEKASVIIDDAMTGTGYHVDIAEVKHNRYSAGLFALDPQGQEIFMARRTKPYAWHDTIRIFNDQGQEYFFDALTLLHEPRMSRLLSRSEYLRLWVGADDLDIVVPGRPPGQKRTSGF